MGNNETGNYCLCGEPFTRIEMAQHSTLCERCLWRKAENITRANMRETVEIVSREIVAQHDNTPDMYLEDTIGDNANSCAEVYRGEAVRQWCAVDMPCAEDYGFESVGTSEDITTALYGWYFLALTNRVSELLEEKAGE